MNNKATIALSICTGVIFLVIGAGFVLSSHQQPVPSTPAQQQKTQQEQLPTSAELAQKLVVENSTILSVITTALPTLELNYTIERAKLYHKGEWYGAILQYKGSDASNRDTLRIVLEKQNEQWKLRTPTPQPLVSKLSITNAPQAMLDDINKPAILSGTETSPTITPKS